MYENLKNIRKNKEFSESVINYLKKIAQKNKAFINNINKDNENKKNTILPIILSFNSISISEKNYTLKEIFKMNFIESYYHIVLFYTMLILFLSFLLLLWQVILFSEI